MYICILGYCLHLARSAAQVSSLKGAIKAMKDSKPSAASLMEIKSVVCRNSRWNLGQ